jgi:hypothetical protein
MNVSFLCYLVYVKQCSSDLFVPLKFFWPRKIPWISLSCVIHFFTVFLEVTALESGLYLLYQEKTKNSGHCLPRIQFHVIELILKAKCLIKIFFCFSWFSHVYVRRSLIVCLCFISKKKVKFEVRFCHKECSVRILRIRILQYRHRFRIDKKENICFLY